MRQQFQPTAHSPEGPRFWPFRKMLVGRGDKVPTCIPKANEFARKIAQIAEASALSTIPEIWFYVPGTAHCTGGCVIAESPDAAWSTTSIASSATAICTSVTDPCWGQILASTQA